MADRPEVRSLAAADLERVVAIDAAYTGRSRRGFFAKRFAAIAGEDRAIEALGAELGGSLEGFVLAQVLDGEFGGVAPVGVVDAVTVSAGAARRGVATALLAAIEAQLAARGVRELRTQADWDQHALVGLFSAAGFRLSPRLVLERGVESRGAEEPYPWEALPVRSMTDRDLAAIVRLDRKITRRDRSRYYERKAAEVLRQSGVRVSLVAEVDGAFAGFLMARVDYGEFGRTEPTAILDTIGVDPGFARRKVATALLAQLLLNLGSLRAERVVTQAEWNHLDLVSFLARSGFTLSQRLAFDKPIG